MDSYGEILRNVRESKNIDRETAALETSVKFSYIVALEEEDDGVFPGEAYMLGFMRIYAEYLGVNPDTVTTLYKNKKLQESPVPENLYIPEKPAYFWPLVLCGIGLFVIAIFAVLFVCIMKKKTQLLKMLLLTRKTL